MRQGCEGVCGPVRSELLVCQSDAEDISVFGSWADDFIRPVFAQSAVQLSARVVQVIQICDEHAAACGIELSFGLDKTACVASPRLGQRLTATGRSSGCLSFFSVLEQKAKELPLVTAYRHLGSVYLLLEGLSRNLAASSTGIVRLPFEHSSFVYGCGALNFGLKQHRRVWHQSYIALHRALCKRDMSTGKNQHSFFVLHFADIPPLACTLPL